MSGLTTTLTRRHVMGLLAGATALPLIAGCGDSGDTGNGTSGSEFTFGIQFNVPPKGVFNMLNGTSNEVLGGYMKTLYLLPGGLYLRGSQKYFYLLADPSSALSKDGKSFTYKIRENLTWSDKSAVTADDVMATWLLRWAGGHPVFNYVDTFSKVDDHTVQFTIKQPAPVVDYYLLEEAIVPASVYGKWSSTLEPLFGKSAYTDDPVKAVMQEVSTFKPDSMIVTGPYIIDYPNVSAQSLVLNKNPHGYLADTVAFDTIKINGSEANEMTLLALNGSVSFTSYGFSNAAIKQFEQSDKLRVIHAPGSWGTALLINYAKLPDLADARVRQALAHVIDLEQNSTIVGPGARPIKLQSGMPDAEVPTWLSDEDQKKLTIYDHDTDKATELLTAAGWKKSGDAWTTASGKPAKFTLQFNSDYPKYVSSAQDLADQLHAFGIELTLKSVATAADAADRQDGKFELGLGGWGTAGNPFPSATFRADMIDNNSLGLAPKPGIAFPLKQHTKVVGDIDLEKAIEASGTGIDEATLKANITKVALAFNELLPILPLYENIGVAPVNKLKTTGWPADDDIIYQNSPYSSDCYAMVLLMNGTVKPA